MNYLQDYVQEAQTRLFEEMGVFFAFNDKQWDEGVAKYGHLKPEGTKWASMGAGMYCPTVNLDAFMIKLNKIHAKGVEQDLKENGREKVLQRELGNYEIGYAIMGHRDQNFRSAIADYGFTEEEIETQYKIHMQENEY